MSGIYEARNKAATDLYTYIGHSIQPRDITLDYDKTKYLLQKLLNAQMQLPIWYQIDMNGQSKIENLTDKNIFKCLTNIRDDCRTKVILVWHTLDIMPPHVRQRVSKRLQEFVLYYVHHGSVKQIEL